MQISLLMKSNNYVPRYKLPRSEKDKKQKIRMQNFNENQLLYNYIEEQNCNTEKGSPGHKDSEGRNKNQLAITKRAPDKGKALDS